MLVIISTKRERMTLAQTACQGWWENSSWWWMGKLIISNNFNGLLLGFLYYFQSSLNPLKKMSMPIIQMRRPRLNLVTCAELSNYWVTDVISNSGISDLEAYALPNIPYSLISPIPKHQNLFSLFQAFDWCPPTMNLIATAPFTLHTFTSGFPPN